MVVADLCNPGVCRHTGAMAVFRVSLLLEPVPQAIFNEIVHGIYEELEESGFDEDEDVHLVSGEHLTAGARYALTDDSTLTLRMWQRDGEIAFDVDSPDSRSAVCIGNDADGPVAWTGTGSSGRSDRKPLTWESTADLVRWWGDSGKKPPVVLQLGHRFGIGRLTMNCASVDGRWKVDVRAKVRGRGLLRPVIGFVMLIGHLWGSRRLREVSARFEAQWNAKAPEILAQLREGPALEQLERLLEARNNPTDAPPTADVRSSGLDIPGQYPEGT